MPYLSFCCGINTVNCDVIEANRSFIFKSEGKSAQDKKEE
jgi:hypothetical protein